MPLEPLTGFPKPPAPARMPNRPGDVPSGNHEHMSAGARLRPTPKKTWDTCEGRTVVVLPPSVVSAPWAVPGHKLAFIQTREGRIAVLLLETRFEQATAQASPGRNSMRPRPFGRGMVVKPLEPIVFKQCFNVAGGLSRNFQTIQLSKTRLGAVSASTLATPWEQPKKTFIVLKQ